MPLVLALLCLLITTPALAQDVMPPDEGGTEEVSDAPAPAAKPSPKPAAQPAAPAEDSAPKQEYNTVILQGLNKVTGKTSKFNAIVGKPQSFGTLEIIAHRCWQASPEERPENAALLEVRELKMDDEATGIFIGWMFSSSPGLSALEHPVYDMTVLSCAHTPGEKTPGEKPALSIKESEKDDTMQAEKPTKTKKP